MIGPSDARGRLHHDKQRYDAAHRHGQAGKAVKEKRIRE
jgi:hypothetical protein